MRAPVTFTELVRRPLPPTRRCEACGALVLDADRLLHVQFHQALDQAFDRADHAFTAAVNPDQHGWARR